MAKPQGTRRDPLAEQIAALAELRRAPLGRDGLDRLRKALQSPKGLLVAKAATLAEQMGCQQLLSELAAAFARFLGDGAVHDRGCAAKLAIVRALIALEADAREVFAAGVRHVQNEPVREGQVDTAGALRGLCLQGLVAMGARDAVFDAVPLLVDAEVEARRLAVLALGMLRADESELLLRLKIAAGDEEPVVLADACSALMAVNPDRSLGFVAGQLDSARAEVSRGAALAIGESRHPDAFRTLHEQWLAAPGRAARNRYLLPLALTRSDAAYALLLDLVQGQPAGGPDAGDPASQEEAAAALRLYKADGARRTQVEQALAVRGSARLARAFED